MVAISVTTAKAQSQMKYSDMVGENPNADADITLVSNYLKNLLNEGDVDKATAMLTSNYKSNGPGTDDSSPLQKAITTWKQNVIKQQNRKMEFVAEAFNVKSGDQAGHWVSVWGTCSCTQDGKNLKFPIQYTAHVTNGKIDRNIVYYDQLYIAKAPGYTVTPPASK